MKTASVSELKTSLSKYLSIVKTGEEIVVTDRGAPVAKLVSVKNVDASARIQRLIREGKATAGPKFGQKWPFPPPKGKPVNAVKALLDERAEAW